MFSEFSLLQFQLCRQILIVWLFLPHSITSVPIFIGSISFFYRVSTSYGSHPVITELVSTTLYNGQLQSGLKATEKTMWREVCFPGPYINVPILFLDITGTEKRSLILSQTNQAQVEATKQIIYTI